MRVKHWFKYLPVVLLAGCAGVRRDCKSIANNNFGADFVVVQFNAQGDAFNCWKLRGVVITSEKASDGLFWTSEKASDGLFWQSGDGRMVHISGWYSYMQVRGKDWATAASTLGVDDAYCSSGRYARPAARPADEGE